MANHHGVLLLCGHLILGMSCWTEAGDRISIGGNRRALSLPKRTSAGFEAVTRNVRDFRFKRSDRKRRPISRIIVPQTPQPDTNSAIGRLRNRDGRLRQVLRRPTTAPLPVRQRHVRRGRMEPVPLDGSFQPVSPVSKPAAVTERRKTEPVPLDRSFEPISKQADPAPTIARRRPLDPVPLEQTVALAPSTANGVAPIAIDRGPLRRTAAVAPAPPWAGNVVVSLGEDFVNRRRPPIEQRYGLVDEPLMGAQIRGTQRTTLGLRVDFRPSLAEASIDVVVSGIVDSQTVGLSPQATVSSVGTHRFTMAKSIYFNGWRVLTQKPRISIIPATRTLAVRSRMSGMPVLGRVADRVAKRAVARRKPEADFRMSRRLSFRLTEPFNEQLDGELARSNLEYLPELERSFEEWGTRPDERHLSTTNDTLNASLRFGEMTETLPMPWTGTRSDQLLVGIHESAVDTVLRRAGLGGQLLTVRDVVDALAQFERALTSGTFNFDAAAADDSADTEDSDSQPLTAFRLDKENPMDVRFRDGVITVETLSRVETAFGNFGEALRVRVTIEPRLEADAIVLSHGEVRIQSEDGSDMTGFFPQVVRQQIKSRMQPIRIPLRLDVPDWDMTVRLAKLEFAGQWMVITLQ